MDTPTYNIAAVERDTGLSKDVLRMWERRYGFPEPARDHNGERLYTTEQIERLRLIKRLMDQGHRPGKLMATSTEELTLLAPRRARAPDPGATRCDAADLEQLLALIKQHDASAYAHALHQRLIRQGMDYFVQDIVAPLTHRVGEAWEDGRFQVFEEHLFTELTKRVLRQAIAALPGGTGSPRVLLTSVPDEQHILGLLMIEALLALDGAECIPLGTQMPVIEISRAAEAHRADIVALSFSIAFPARQIPPLLQQIRAAIPHDIDIWVGGAGVSRLPPLPGIKRLYSLAQGVQALDEWRRGHTPQATTTG